MDYKEYLQVPEFKSLQPANKRRPRLLDVVEHHTNEYFPDLDNIRIAIIGVPEDRLANRNIGCAGAADAIRPYLYNLFPPQKELKIADLGNIREGLSPIDTYVALGDIVSMLIEKDIFPVILGGSQDLTIGNYLAYENTGQSISLLSIDNTFDLGDGFNSGNAAWLNDIIMRQPNFLFNYSNLGYQTYFVDQEAIRLMKNLSFDAYRLGAFNQNLEDTEPIIRNADCISIDISSIRCSDAPGCANSTPNGLYGEQLCRIARYAGMSDKLSSIGFYEYNPHYDNHGQTGHLIAQAIWYIIDGVYNRVNDQPYRDDQKDQYIRYFVNVDGQDDEIIFMKSKKSDRWWMQVSCPVYLQTKYMRHIFVPCTYSDYQMACNNDLPDRWWQVYQKLM